MAEKELDAANLGRDEDWLGNNAAFTCPQCGNVFLVSGMLNRAGGRACPTCDASRGFVQGGAQSGGHAWIEW